MSDTKKPDDSVPPPPPEPLRESVDYSEAPCDGVYDNIVTNTLPAPPNPNQGGGQKEDK